jgi:hypothetical protein
MRARGRWIAVALGASAIGAQCRASNSVSFEINLPRAISGQAQWMEVGVFDGPCPGRTELAGGIPRSGTLTRLAFPKGDTSPPLVGDLKKASYGFAAVARDSNCAVVATGCNYVDLTKATDVSIELAATQTPAGACVAGETCAEAQCVPVPATTDPTLGAGCSMQLVGAGPLGDPMVFDGDVVSAPAVVATESGFLVAYREYDPNGGTGSLTLAAIDPGGGLTIASPTALSGQCAGQVEADAVGLAYVTGGGVVVSARPSCGSGEPGGLDAFAVDKSGNVTGTAFNSVPGSTPTLSNAHAASLAGSSSGWVALLDSFSAQLVGLSGLNTNGGAAAFGGPPPQTLAQVVASDQMLALLAANTPAAAQMDGGGSTQPVLTLLLRASPTDPGTPYVFPATWGAIAAEGGRAFVLGNSPVLPSVVNWAAVDLGSAAPAASDTFAPAGQGAVIGGDVAFHGDRMMFVVEQPGSIAVAVYDHASTTPTLLRNLLLSDDPRVPPQATVRDGRVAIAASDSRVAVTWVTAANLGLNDAVGGYALYACSP